MRPAPTGPETLACTALVAPLLRSFDRQRLAMLRATAAPPGRLLDAGALGLPVQRTGIESADIPASSVDVVTLRHVLEHLDDPAGALADIGRWLRPTGILLIGVPNLSIAAVPLVPVAALAELIAGLSHRGGTIAVLARRAE
jgi:SAM-dependent methyltransferase